MKYDPGVPAARGAQPDTPAPSPVSDPGPRRGVSVVEQQRRQAWGREWAQVAKEAASSRKGNEAA